MGGLERLNTNNAVKMDVEQKEETVEELMAKLAQKGQKVKLVKDDESPMLSHQTTMKETKKGKKGEKGRNKENQEDLAKQRELEQIALQKQQQNDALQNELQAREDALEKERVQKENLTKLIAEMEKKFVKGGHGMDNMDEKEKEQIRKERKLQKQLKKQKIKE